MSIATFLQGSKRSLMDRLRGVDSEEEQTPGSDAHANGTPTAEPDRPSLAQDLSQSPLPQTRPSLRDELTSKPSMQLGPAPPQRPSVADELKAKQDAIGQQPTTTRGKIGKAIMTALPTALGGIFGGAEGASGAAEGTMAYQDVQRQQENLQRKSIGEELEAERQRQAQLERDQANRQFESSKLGEELRARAEEAATNRTFQTSERLGEQDFRLGEGDKQRAFQTSERIGGEAFRLGESKLERDMRISQEEANRKFQGAEGAANRASRERISQAGDATQLEAARLRGEQRPPTESERRMFAFHGRISTAKQVIDSLEGQISKSGLPGQLELKAPNMLQGDVAQRYSQAASDFINAALRRESGAAISPSEYTRFNRIYFPQPGDKPETLKQKATARDEVLSSLKTEAGRAYQESFSDEPPADTGGQIIQQHNKVTGADRYSTDGGKTWRNGKPPSR